MFWVCKQSFANYAIIGFSLWGLVACGGGSSGSSGGSQSPDPVVVDLPIAYIKRPLPVDPDDPLALVPDDILDPGAFNPGAALYLRERAAPGAAEVNVTDRAWPEGELYDVKDLEVSPDGEKLLFAMRAPDDPDLNDDEQAKWDIWEYERETDTLRRIIQSDTIAQQNHDIAPHYLPDGRIVFSSNRQQRTLSILLGDGKPQYAGLHEGNLNNGDESAFVLHVMDDDGTDIDQITYNQSHDLQPAALQDGRIIFLRWDRYRRDNLSLYTVNPDGTNLQFYYGFHSQETGTNDTVAAFSQPREMPDGRILTVLRTRENDRFGGDIALIDGRGFTEIDQPTNDNAGATGPAQVSASLLDVFIDDGISPHGYFGTAYPFFDDTDRLLVSWNQCRLVNPEDPDTFLPCTDENLLEPEAEEADPAHGVWIYNPADGTQLPVITPEDDILYSEAVAMEPRDPPDFIQPISQRPDTNPDYLEEGLGVVHIRSVYDFDGVDPTPNGLGAFADPGQTTWDNRPARFLRIVKAVSIPPEELLDFNTEAFGVNGAAQSMREILGYVPIEPDGSVKFEVPADMAFTISILDANGRRLPQFQRHQNWLQVRAGEELECKGCHTRNSEAPHGRFDAQAPSINPGAPTDQPFPNTLIDAQMGQTMAEAYGTRTPSVDIEFSDDWSAVNAAASIIIRYADLDTSLAAPTFDTCQGDGNWSASCRITINYETHIQPIWELPRQNMAMEDRTCTTCHQPADAQGDPAVPAGQLDLRNVAAEGENVNFRIMSYQELLTNDDQQEEVDGAIVDVLEPRLDANGDPVLDENGNAIMDPIPAPRTMNPAGANASNAIADNTRSSGTDFFSWFESPPDDDTIHEDLLTEAELKLISEWLDIGAQYYNNPFDAPVN